MALSHSGEEKMKEQLIKTILANLDGEMRVISLLKMADEILALWRPNVDWAKIDPDKWGDWDNMWEEE